MAELRPCPFCGDNQQLNYVELSNGLHYIECVRCGAAPHKLGAWDRETAVKYWNSVNRWIPCSERLPEKHVEVLAYSPYWGKIVVAMWGGEFWLEQWTDDDLEQSEISHWMPLPEPPEKEANENAGHS